jgi:predicted DNA binding CopG/RHH family protein
MKRSEKKARIPPFRSDHAERDFWARHSVEEFARDLTDLEIEIRPPRTEQIALRLHKEDLEAHRSLAAARGVGHTTLARTVLEGWLARSRSKRKRGAAGKSIGRRDRLRSDIDYAQNYAREGPISAQIHPSPPNIENKNPSVSSRLTEGPSVAGQVCKGRALPN